MFIFLLSIYLIVFGLMMVMVSATESSIPNKLLAFAVCFLWPIAISVLFVAISISVFGFVFYMTLAVTESTALNRQLSFLTYIFWPIFIPALFIAIRFYPDDQFEETTSVADVCGEPAYELAPQG